MDSKSQPAKSREDYEDILDVDDNQSWDALRAKGIIDFKHRVSLSVTLAGLGCTRLRLCLSADT